MGHRGLHEPRRIRHRLLYYLARATVSQILKQAGIRIGWHGDAGARAASGVSIAIYEQTPSVTAPGVLARAQPYDGGHGALF